MTCPIRKSLLAALALVCGGCAVGPDFHRPKTAMPSTFTGAMTRATSRPTTRSIATEEIADVAQWWRVFNDPELDSLVRRGVDSNLDLRQAESRIRQARASRGLAFASLFPTLDTSDSYSRSGGGTSQARDLYHLGLDASWEIDIFGGVRRNVEASDADLQASFEDRRDVLVTLTSELAIDYLDLRGSQQELKIALENLQSQRYTADLTRRRQRGGFVSSLDVVNADAQVASTESTIPVIEQSIQQSIFAISVLLGREPQTLTTELAPPGVVPRVPPAIPVGLPSDLLRRRPDIRRAEAQLHAATARIGVAVADWFPRVSLTGDTGYESTRTQQLFNSKSNFWSFGPSVQWNIFDAGAIDANIHVQDAIQQQALLTYRQAILTSLQDVDNALVAYEQEQRHHFALEKAVDENRKAVDISTQLYSAGRTNFLDVLNAQRSLFGSQDSLVQSDRTIATNLVALYKALGGGWEAAESGHLPTTRPIVDERETPAPVPFSTTQPGPP